jgi:hypothetical protein
MMWFLAVFVPLTEAEQARLLAHAVWPDDPNGSTQLTVSLKDGSGTAWIGANAAVTDSEIASLQGLGNIPDVKWFRYSMDGVLGMAFPTGPTEGSIWGWTDCLVAAGLTHVAAE